MIAALLFYSAIDPVEQWVGGLKKLRPDLEIRIYPDIGDVDEIDYALIWRPPAGLLASLPNLKLIHAIGAGIDALLEAPDLPPGVPIVRMVDPCLQNMMSEYAVYAVLDFHRGMARYRAQQAAGEWQRHWPPMTFESPVGILGLGVIGRDLAGKFSALGFPVEGWSRTQKELPGVTCHAGDDGLKEILGSCAYIICVLPLTAETRGLIDRDFLARMRPGSHLISIGRGAQVVDDDLITALDQGNLAGAFLDVFDTEPLPAEHPFWRHPKISLTPHIAAETDPAGGAQVVIDNLRRFEAGEPIPTQVDRDQGY